tara:strand:+ start:324 stop:434 length:111 start_codon:yes stop_codon:yes gene_type:complete
MSGTGSSFLFTAGAFPEELAGAAPAFLPMEIIEKEK